MHELEALSAPQLRDLITDGVRTVVVPFGSVEHQGGHLPLGADAMVADSIGREVAARLGAVLAPTVRIGDARRHIHEAGTLTLEPGTLSELAFDIGVSLAENGFQVVAFVSTHGGNTEPLHASANRLNAMFDPVSTLVPEGDVGPDPGSHSGEWLTSVMLALRPDLVELEATDETIVAEVRAASLERGAVHFERFVTAVVDEIRRSTGG